MNKYEKKLENLELLEELREQGEIIMNKYEKKLENLELLEELREQIDKEYNELPSGNEYISTKLTLVIISKAIIVTCKNYLKK